MKSLRTFLPIHFSWTFLYTNFNLFFHILKRNKKPRNCAVITIYINPTQFYWLKELTLHKKRPRKKQIVSKITKSLAVGCLLYFFLYYHFASEKQEKYMLNDNKFTVYFHIKLDF